VPLLLLAATPVPLSLLASTPAAPFLPVALTAGVAAAALAKVPVLGARLGRARTQVQHRARPTAATAIPRPLTSISRRRARGAASRWPGCAPMA